MDKYIISITDKGKGAHTVLGITVEGTILGMLSCGPRTIKSMMDEAHTQMCKCLDTNDIMMANVYSVIYSGYNLNIMTDAMEQQGILVKESN
jgi:hypothetical protein